MECLPLRTFPSPHRFTVRLTPLIAALSLAYGALPLRAQIASPAEIPSTFQIASLPDSPGSMLHRNSGEPEGISASSDANAAVSVLTVDADSPGGSDQIAPPAVAAPTHLFILPGQQAPSLTSADKVRLGLRNAVTPFASVGWLTAAAYSQALDSNPKYGQGWGPFGQRLGAAAARGISEEIFSNSIFAPVFHEDPRYYMLGRGHSPLKRVVYAATRTFVTRSDNGKATPNLSLLSGNAAGAILTNAYYPDASRSVKVTAETFAGSIGGSALGFGIREFLSDLLGAVHLSAIE